MTITQFIDLSLQEKIKLLYEEGAFVMNIRYYEYKINLYQMNDFMVEVFYHHKKDCIEKVIPMEKNHSRQKFYADQIRLPEEM